MNQKLIEKAHDGKTAHCGKIPLKTPKDTKKQMELLNLRQQLEAAVQSEDYELAAELRDKIRKLEAGMAGRKRRGTPKAE